MVQKHAKAFTRVRQSTPSSLHNFVLFTSGGVGSPLLKRKLHSLFLDNTVYSIDKTL